MNVAAIRVLLVHFVSWTWILAHQDLVFMAENAFLISLEITLANAWVDCLGRDVSTVGTARLILANTAAYVKKVMIGHYANADHSLVNAASMISTNANHRLVKMVVLASMKSDHSIAFVLKTPQDHTVEVYFTIVPSLLPYIISHGKNS